MVVGVLYCEDATVHLELGISSRWKESWRIWTKTVSNLQQNWVWIITLSFKMIKIAYTKPWLKCHWKSTGWTEDQGPSKNTIKSGGAWEIGQRKMGLDCSGGTFKTCWKLQQDKRTADCYPAKNGGTNNITETNNFDAGSRWFL